MRILSLCPDLGIPVLGQKGASVHVRALADALSALGHHVLLAAPKLVGSPWDRPEAVSADVLHLPPDEDVKAAALAVGRHAQALDVESGLPGELRRILYNEAQTAKLPRRFAKAPPDFIYERASLHWTAGAALAAAIDRPLIVELNAPLALEQEHYRRSALTELAVAAERRTLSSAHAVLCVSESLRAHAISAGASPERVHVVPNGVDPAAFRPRPRSDETRRQLGLNGGPVLGFVGGLRPWHGVEALPELLERVRAAGHDATLLLVGDGPLRESLAAEFARRGIAECVVFTGWRPHQELPGLVTECDIALAPYPDLSHDFYFSPLKLYEYMAAGTPVVASRTGQIAEMIRDGHTGLLHAPGDVAGMTQACLRLLSDEALGRRIGAAASTEVRTNHTWSANAQKVVDVAGSGSRPGAGA